MKTRSKLEPGAVLEVQTPSGLGYIRYEGIDSVCGDGVTVALGLHSRRPPPDSLPFADGYFAFYPARAAIRERLVEAVGMLPAAGIPSRMRRAFGRDGAKVLTWILVENGRDVRLVDKLSQSELRLPIERILSHSVLVRQLVESWRPEHEGAS